MNLKLKQIKADCPVGSIPIKCSDGQLKWRGHTPERMLVEGIKVLDGNSTTPSYTFTNDDDTGFCLLSPAKIGVSTSGTLRMFINTASITSYLPIRVQKSNSPTVTFDGDTDTGMGSMNNDSLNFYTGGVSSLNIDSTNASFNIKGSVTVPSGTTVERPVGSAGMMRYNTDSDSYEAYHKNGGWSAFVSTARTLQTANVYIANNAVYSFVPQVDGGVLVVSAKYLNTSYTEMVKYYTTNPSYCNAMFFKTGTNIITYTQVLTGTTGSNGCINVSANSNGKLYIENRTGSGKYLQFTILGI